MVVEPHPSFTEFLYMNRNGRNKLPMIPSTALHWNTPYAEETKYMVNPECVKIIAHLLKPLCHHSKPSSYIRFQL